MRYPNAMQLGHRYSRIMGQPNPGNQVRGICSRYNSSSIAVGQFKDQVVDYRRRQAFDPCGARPKNPYDSV